MDVEISYIPKHYFSSEPDAGGFFPFAIDGTANYVFDTFYHSECNENWLPLWMENMKAFPLYFSAQIPFYWKEDYEHICKEFNINYRYLTDKQEFSVSVTEVQNEKQFREILPFYVTLGSENDLVLWSANKDVFSVEQREWKGNWEGKVAEAIVVKLEADTSIFWIGYDGDSIAVISNNPQFSTYEQICGTLPKFINPTQGELV